METYGSGKATTAGVVGDALGISSPWYANALEAMPSTSTVVGFNSWRGSQTAMYGGWGTADDLRLKRSMRPANFARMASPEAFSLERRGYSPIGTTARVVNWAAKKPSAAAQLAKIGYKGAPTPFMTPGLLSNLTTAARLGRMGTSSSIGIDMARNLNAMDRAVSGIKGGRPRFGAWMTGSHAAANVLDSGGFINRTIGGFGHAARFGDDAARLGGRSKAFRSAATWGAKKFGDDTLGLGFRAAARQTAKKGVSRAAVGFAGRWAARWGASMAVGGPANPVVAIGMTAWMAYDLAKLGTGLASDLIIKPAVNTARDASVSLQGQIKKPVMGMGFVDNSVAATSRSRGVAAIQNSRLNARSMLGNEASMMHSHFG